MCGTILLKVSNIRKIYTRYIIEDKKIRDSVDKTTAKAKLSEALGIAKSAGLTSDEIKDIFKK